MSRIKKIITNAKVNVFFYSLTIIIGFFSRKIFLDYLGAEFMGLVSLVGRILNFLNLAELGISTAVGYALYKPLFDKNKNEINDIVQFFGFLYRKIGFAILVAGLVISLFLPFLLSNTPFSNTLIYFIFFVFLFSTTFNYFFNYHITLLKADQKDYVVSKYMQSTAIVKSLIQILLVYLYKDFYLWILIEFLFSLILVFVLRTQIKKVYPWLSISLPINTKSIRKFPEILVKIRQIVIHKFSFFVLHGTDQILIYAFINIQSVAYYGNYLMIFQYFTVYINKLFSGAQASVGNLIAESNPDTIKKVFFEIIAVRHFLGGFLLITLYHLTDPFIVLWIGEIYILDKYIVLVMIINLYIGQIRKPVDDFINGYGIFSDTWAPAVQASLNLIISLILGKLYGIIGIVLGTTISLTLIVILWKPYFLYKIGFREPVKEYWMNFAKLGFSLVVTFFVIHLIKSKFLIFPIENFFQWIIQALVISLLSIIIYASILFTVSQGFRNFYFRVKKLVIKFIS